MASQIASIYGIRKPEYTASQICAVNIAKREYQREYLEYWNSTTSLTGTGRSVDAIVAPVAPFAAARPDMYYYYGMYATRNADCTQAHHWDGRGEG